MHFLYITATAFVIILSLVHANPFNDTLSGELTIIQERSLPYGCSFPVSYNISSQTLIQDTSQQITGVQVGPDPAGGSIQAGYTYSKSTSFTGGIAGYFTFKEVFQFGVTASAGVTYTHGASVSGSQNCPANIICGLTASAEMLHVVGTMTQHACSGIGSDKWPCSDLLGDCPFVLDGAELGTPVPYTADYPVKVGDSLVDGQDEIVVTFRACYVGTSVAGLDACPT